MEDMVVPDVLNYVFYPKEHTLKILWWYLNPLAAGTFPFFIGIFQIQLYLENLIIKLYQNLIFFFFLYIDKK